MKPECIKSILASYLREKQCTSAYDDVDGPLCAQSFSGYEDRYSELLFMAPESASSQPENFYDPLDPQTDALVRGIGRQLSEMSDEFECDYSRSIENQASAIGNKIIHFKHQCMFVPPNCGNIEIPIVRTGIADGTAKVAWRTFDKTAKAGTHYMSGGGNISFADGDKEKTLEIEMIRNHSQVDICFVLELYDPEGIEIGSLNPLTIYISDHTKLYDEEKQVVENIINCGPNALISSISSCCLDKVTENTFKTALQCLCSSANSFPQELAFASELVRLTMHRANLGTLSNVFCDFFSYLPELEDIVQYFDGIN